MKVQTTFSADDVQTILTGVAANRTGQDYNRATHHEDGSVTLFFDPAHAPAQRKRWWHREPKAIVEVPYTTEVVQ